MNSHRRKKRRRRRNRIPGICRFIIGICITFIVGCTGFIIVFAIEKPRPHNTELIQEMNEIAEYYQNEMIDQSNEILDNSDKSNNDKVREEISIVKEEDERPAAESQESNKINEERERELRDLLNNASLEPRSPDSPELAALLEDLMPEIIGNCEDTYEKVKACYDFLINECTYSQTIKYTYEQDAYLLLTEFHGSCTYYAAAFHYMMCYIGLDDQIISGYRYLDSRKSFHRWNEITIEGIPYVFDAQWEDTLSRYNEVAYIRFCMTHEEVEKNYEFQ